MTGGAAHPRLIIHLGYHKSGSSAIQRWLLNHAKILAPHLTTFNLFDGSTRGLKIATNRLVLGRATDQEIRGQAGMLRRLMDDSTAPTICITDESLPGLPLGWRDDTYEETEIYPYGPEIVRILAEEFAAYKPVFVVFEREAEAWLRSTHNQMSKQGSITDPFDTYIARVKPVVDWPGLRQDMEAGIGANGSLIAYPFEAEFAKSTVREMGFFQLLDLPDTAWAECQPHLDVVNPSVSEARAKELSARAKAKPQRPELKPADVTKAYRLMLGRLPENPAAIERKRMLPNLDALGRQIMRSDEFRRRYEAIQTPDTPSDPVVIHLHIPKTAGSSFTSILSDAFANKMRFAYQTLPAFSAVRESQRLKIDMIFGHLYYGLHTMLRPNYLYLFVLRDPKARIYSFFKYIQKAEDHPLHAAVNEDGLDFGAFLSFADSQPGRVAEIDNGQMMRVAGIDAAADTDYAQAFRLACQHAMASTTEFGLVEDFPAYLDRLKARGIIAEGSSPKTLNTTGSTDTLAAALDALTPHQTDILERYTLWDERFYQICAAYLGASSAA